MENKQDETPAVEQGAQQPETPFVPDRPTWLSQLEAGQTELGYDDWVREFLRSLSPEQPMPTREDWMAACAAGHTNLGLDQWLIENTPEQQPPTRDEWMAAVTAGVTDLGYQPYCDDIMGVAAPIVASPEQEPPLADIATQQTAAERDRSNIRTTGGLVVGAVPDTPEGLSGNDFGRKPPPQMSKKQEQHQTDFSGEPGFL